MLFTALVSFWVIAFNDTNVYRGLFILPLVFAISCWLIYVNILSRTNCLTAWGLIVISYLRYVLCPMTEVLSGYINQITKLYSEQSASVVSLVMSWELLCVTLAILLAFKVNIKNGLTTSKNQHREVNLKGNRILYVVFLMIVVVLFILFRRSGDLKLNFILIDSNTNNRVGDIDTTLTSFIAMILRAAMAFAYLVFLQHWNRTNRSLVRRTSGGLSKGYMISLFMALLIICVIIGERRTAQLYTMFALCCTMIKVFPNKRKHTILIMTASCVAVLILMSIYKVFNAFAYSSYSIAIRNSTFNMRLIAEQIDSYFYGPITTMMNISYANSTNASIGTMFYDVARSTFGISFLLKNKGVLTSELYNAVLYGGAARSGYLMSSIGYGCIYLGYVLSPVVTIIRLLFTIGFERRMKKTRSLEYTYLWSYCFIANIFSFYGSIIPHINSLSRMIISYAFVILCASFVQRRTFSYDIRKPKANNGFDIRYDN